MGAGREEKGGGDAPPPGEGDSPIERKVRTACEPKNGPGFY